jgi:type I restriction enzyme S subunit
LPLLARSNTQDNLNAEQVRNLPVPDRPRPAQNRIVADLMPQLDKIGQLQECLSRQSLLLRERRRAPVTAAVTGELEIPGVA